MSAIVFDISKLVQENEFDPGSPIYPENFPVDRVWNILINYVQPHSPLSQADAVDEVAQCYDSMSGSISAVYDALLYVAEQIPYHHPSHKKLADFVLALLGDERTLCKRNARRRSSQDPILYVNNCAFVADLVEPGWSSRRFGYGLANDALEGAVEARAAAPEIRDAQVIGAAQFITFQVPTIFEEVMKDRRYEAQVIKAKGRLAQWGLVKKKPRHNYDLPFASDRWQAWEHAFRTIADDETYGKECRAVAQQAVDLMALQVKIEIKQPKEA